MKKVWFRIAAIVLLATLMCPGTMAMELKRGDRGEMVASVQEMLIDLGLLLDEADGVFGKNTRQAVMDFEAAYGFPVDGIVDDVLYEAICVAWIAAQEEGADGEQAGESNGVYDETVSLNDHIIICGDRIYYSGAVSGEDMGVYIIDVSTRNARRISDEPAKLKALCTDNLLVQYRRPGEDEATLAILEPDGNIISLGSELCGYAIEGYGRFYWNQGSCGWDGSDLRMLFSEDEAWCIRPILVDGDYLYYEDGNALEGVVFSEGMDYIPAAQLWRISLEDGSRQMLSDVGSKYLGFEDGRIYYSRQNYRTVNADSYEVEHAVEQGVYRLDPETMETVCLLEFENGEDSFTRWEQLADGVIYGIYVDFSREDEACIVRIDTEGNFIYELPLGDAYGADLICIDDGVWYATAFADEGGEVLVCLDLEDGSSRIIPFEQNESLYYAAGLPELAVVDDVVYYYCHDELLDAYCLKSMDLNGGDKALYAFRDASYLSDQ